MPEDPGRLEEAGLVRRMCRIGADLQLTAFLHELVTAAITVGAPAGEGVVDALCAAARLVGGDAAHVHRMWRVAHLVGVLRPGGDAPDWGRAAYRACDLALEGLLQVDTPARV